ncbi:MAG: hypothetical protein HRU75_05170 [Planctomycetia bacterium]|nr:MAG: hypothetical protein HRU75_05170 [Planctomycetia bacterium]
MTIRFAALAALSLLATTAAFAQQGSISVGAQAYGSRSPSQEVGRLGGYNTRFQEIGGRRRGGGGGGGLDFSANLAPAGGFRGVGGGTILPPAFRPGPSGYSRISTSGTSRLSSGAIVAWRPPDSRTISQLSGFDLAVSMDTPEGGWDFGSGPQIKQFPYAASEGSEFNQFFRLQPAETEPRSGAPAGMAENYRVFDAVSQSNTARVRDMAWRGLDMFRRATDMTDDDGELLPRAMDVLASVRNLKSDAVIPSVLIAHGAMHRGQYWHALNSLRDALKRNPEFFVDRIDITPYFGSPEFLRRQLRELQQAGQLATESVQAAALEAYCSFLLNDDRRAGAALERMSTLMDRTPVESLTVFRSALAAGLLEAMRREEAAAAAARSTPAAPAPTRATSGQDAPETPVGGR